eukprot:15443107-Alexandrium_andersonii.AAC.1
MGCGSLRSWSIVRSVGSANEVTLDGSPYVPLATEKHLEVSRRGRRLNLEVAGGPHRKDPRPLMGRTAH